MIPTFRDGHVKLRCAQIYLQAAPPSRLVVKPALNPLGPLFFEPWRAARI